MSKFQSKQAKKLFLVTFLLVFFVSCSSNEQSETNENWETFSTNSERKKPEIDYSRSEDKISPSDKTKEGRVENKTNKNLNISTNVGKRMYKEYGAMFFAKNGAISPSKVVFSNESDVSSWQNSIPKNSETINGITIVLQKPAMEALLRAIDEAKQKGVSISPRGKDAAKRNYEGTVSLWKSRVNPGLNHWMKKGRLNESEAQRIKSLPIPQQISEIFKLEKQGMFFSKDKSKSIIYSVAPPGTSQHISMLALDVSEHENQTVRQILAKHGWFQTVISDTPHFTYLGVKEGQLRKLGLKKTMNGNRIYWVPNI